MSVVDNIIAPVRELSEYTLKATVARVKLNQNESPRDLSPELKRLVLDRVAALPWNRYPDFVPADVLAGIGEMHGLGGENVLIGNGSNELIQALFAACVESGTKVSIPSPTFTLYAMMVRANGGEVDNVRLRDDLSYDLDAWRERAARGDRHLLLCSPNNPTGSTVTPKFVSELASATSKLVIVDEAYAQFGDDDHSRLLGDHDNVVVLRTFSKAMGLAGVRLGYALVHRSLAPEINKVKLPYNVGIFGLEVARLALEEPSLFVGVREEQRRERGRLVEALRALPLEAVYDGAANFVLIRTAQASGLFESLFEAGVLIRNVGHYPMLESCLRVSVGTPEQNDEVLERIAGYLKAHSSDTDSTEANS